ncbi:MAG: serine protease [Candidatus Nomurabacteria bacterium]
MENKENQNNWQTGILSINPSIFKISTPTGYGTGFLIFKNDQNLCGIATAYHVIAHAYEWNEPIKISQHISSKERFLISDPTIRVIEVDKQRDLAFILFKDDTNNPFDIEEKDIPKLIDIDQIIDVGTEIGWTGFPVIEANSLCFFAGYISCHLQNMDSYLVDGVAINGVSGAPAFFIDKNSSELKICGVISNYFPNKSTGDSLPGLSMIRSVTVYKQRLENLQSMDEARRKAQNEVVKEAVDEESH